MPDDILTFGATCVSVDGAGVFLLGSSGTGKSDMALRLINRGALLVADDRVQLARREGKILANPPPSIAGLLEIRELGIFRFPYAKDVAVSLVIRLEARGNAERLPYPEFYECMEINIPQITIYPFDVSAAVKVEMAVATLKDGFMIVGAFRD